MKERGEKQKVFCGEKELSKFGEKLQELGRGGLLLVSGRNIYEKSGAAVLFEAFLSSVKITRVRIKTRPPEKKEIEKIQKKIKGRHFSAIFALGGGSVIDAAKCLKHLYGRKEIPLLAAPTTAGSGSEATHFAAIYSEKRKQSIAHRSLLPDFVLLYPLFLKSVPRESAAAAAMDVLAQGIESFWSVNSTEQSKKFAKKAITLAWKYMDLSVLRRDAISNQAMMRASNLAGQAINISRTTSAHALSYFLTSQFGVLHGHAVGLFLPGLFKLNATAREGEVLDARGADYLNRIIHELCKLLGAKDADQAAKFLVEKLKKLGMETSLEKLGIGEEENLSAIVREGLQSERMKNNPRDLSKAELRGMIKPIFVLQ